MSAAPLPVSLPHARQPDRVFAEIAELAAQICDAAHAVITLHEAGVHRPLAQAGRLGLETLPGDSLFCCAVLHGGAPLEVCDAHFDLRFHDDPLVVSGPRVRFYSGVPLLAGSGAVLGTLSVLDGRPKSLAREQREALWKLADVVVQLLADIAALVGAQRQLAAMNAELERRVEDRTRELRASNEELEAFSYTVAHDLRAPLRAIDGYSHLLGDAAAAGEAAEVPRLLAKVRRNVTGMERLIDGLLHFARLGRQVVAAVPVDMRRLAAEAQLTLADQFPRTAIRIEPMPAVRGDPEMLRQVWMNLLANACKFSRDVAEPRVVAAAQASPGGTTFLVRDNGAGFDMAYADKLFGMFQRLHTEREFGGHGVGLAVVARIVARHGGRVWAEGAPGRGATFFFFLPAAPADSVAA